MQKIALLTDSAADISVDLMKKYNIQLAPFRIIYSDGSEYEDGINIKPAEIYRRLKEEMPSTSLPSVQRIENILCNLEAEGYTHIICITISSELSGTWNSIRLALENHPNLTSYVYDSKTLTMAEGALVLSTAKLIEEGKSFEEIIDVLPKLRTKVHTYFIVDTLEYLKKGGRIGKVAGTIGELLNLKPLITVGDDGVYHTYAKIRGKKQAISKLKEIAKGYLTNEKCNLWVMDGGAQEEGDALFEAVKDFDNINEIHRGIIGSSLGIHTGPGLIGFVIEEVE